VGRYIGDKLAIVNGVILMDEMFNTIEKQKVVYVFIDASNIWAAQKSKGKLLDYDKVVKKIIQIFNPKICKFFYYSAYPIEGTRVYSLDGKHKFFTFLKKGLKFIVRKKPLKRIKVENELGESVKEKGDMDVEIVVDAMHNIDNYEIAVFFTGDSDFLALINYLKNHNKRVYIFSSKNNISNELRTSGNGYSDILLIDDIWGNILKNKNTLL